MKKTYLYKVYTSAGEYITTWSDVASDPTFTQEINGAGSEMVVVLSRKASDYDEQISVDFNNIVEVYVKDTEAITPTLFFRGKIVNYSPKFQDIESVEVTLYSLGFELESMLYRVSESPEQSQTGAFASTADIAGSNVIAQSFIPDQPTLTSLDLRLSVGTSSTVTVSVHEDLAGNPATTAITNGTSSKLCTNTTYQVIKFPFSTAPILTVGDTYWIKVSA